MKPEDALEKLSKYVKQLEKARRLEVAVGLPLEKASAKIYENGQTVLSVGASHEFGTKDLPRRSFLRDTFTHKKKEIKADLDKRFKQVLSGKQNAENALNLVGIAARNYVIEAFRTQGFGHWPDDSDLTKERKKSDTVLIDTGTLRNSITWVVRDAK